MARSKVDSDGNATNGQTRTSGSGEKSPYTRTVSGNVTQWNDVDGDSIIDAIDAITRNGDAVLFARSSDSGVLVATVCTGDQRIKFYARTGEEMTGHLQEIKRNLDLRQGR